MVDAAAVDVAVGEVFEHVLWGADVGLVGEDFRASWAYALDVLELEGLGHGNERVVQI